MVTKKISAPATPDRRGAITQARNTWTTPELISPPHQIISSEPISAIPIPRIPPRMEWVVETGRPILVQMVRYIEEATTAQHIPSMRRGALSVNASILTTLVRIVSETLFPTPTLKAQVSTRTGNGKQAINLRSSKLHDRCEDHGLPVL